jgi:DNA mismatch repair protein MutS
MDAPVPHEATASSTEAPVRITPMMEQYVEIKAAHADHLLFYRMGDFYELFFEDAETASRTLGIVLTKRGKHLGRDIPMCGVPVERSDEYLHKLIAAGHRVAVCEQTEDPAEARKRGNKSVVRRDVVRLITRGTLTEDTLLDARRNNYLAAVVRERGSGSSGDARYGLAWIDISSGEFCVAERDRSGLAAEIARLSPGEIIVGDSLYEDRELAAFWRDLGTVTPLAKDAFDGASAERRLAAYFGVASSDAFGAFSRLELTAAAACTTYVERTQLGGRPPLSAPSREASGATMQIDAATRVNLELIATLTGDRRGSLLAAIDRTITAAGGRLLARRLAAPLTDRAAINGRLDAVASFASHAVARSRVREHLAACPDIARALSRIALGRAGPRDLAAIRDGIAAGHATAETLQQLADAPAELVAAAEALRTLDRGLCEQLTAALADDLPLLKRDGSFIRASYANDLDDLRALRDESRRVIAALQAGYAESTGIRALKIRHNNVLGYFVDVPAQHGEKLLTPPHNATFIHRQTLAGQVRFTTRELGELEAKIASAGERALALELALFDELSGQVTASTGSLKAAADALAAIDVASALAMIAEMNGYVRPEITTALEFSIDGGRHPVVEQALQRQGEPFVSNLCDLSPPNGDAAGRIWLVTGPNMAGKSTFLRQNALIAVMAQAGSFVPAKAARIGIVDRLFSRVGAADDLARGRSTFMVEMVETAAILNQATSRSLVILDEIGRGTATFDGLSIAWATIESLHETNRCRALFATHFHELTALAAKLQRLQNVTVRVKEWHGDVVFLHEVIPGAADRSYGIQVAKLAGLPRQVIERAREVLAELEAQDRISPARKLVEDLPLFASGKPKVISARDAEAEALLEVLAELDPNDMSPREALEALYALKAKLPGNSTT